MLPHFETRRAVLEIFFKAYLRVWAPYGKIVATSPDLSGVAYIYDESLFQKDMKYAIAEKVYLVQTLKMLKYISIARWRHFHQTLSVMSSDWISNHIQGEYIHLDLIAVRKNHRGKGLAKKLITYGKTSAHRRGIPLTLETQNAENEKLYEHLGFKTCETIAYSGLEQYCMFYK